MIHVQELTLSFGDRTLFKDVNITFKSGECYGIIGANGAGKSTFLRILSGEIEPDRGSVTIPSGLRMAALKQDQSAFDDHSVLHTVIMGHPELYRTMLERDAIYEKEDFSEEDGIRASELEAHFAELNGWEAESEAGQLLDGLGMSDDTLELHMRELEPSLKVRVLLAQALFGSPDILLLDEPTNNLDLESINWLEDFLYRFDNTVIVVSHDRHFLNKVCTQTADIDYGRIQLFPGNYDFWYESSQLMQKQMRDQKKRTEEKASELKEFIQRFSSNASKAKQATARKKLLDKLTIDDIKPSSRRFPYVHFKAERSCGDKVLEAEGIACNEEGEQVLPPFDISVQPGDKIAFVGPMNRAKTLFFESIMGRRTPDAGSYNWGVTITPSYFPADNSEFFREKMSLIEWLRQFSPDAEETYVRGFLGRMLFSGDEALKSVTVLSGGEKVRCMLSKMMLQEGNVIVLDDPTNHLDLESITALNNALEEFPEVVMLNSHDHQLIESVANRIIEFTPAGVIDRRMDFDEYVESEKIRTLRDELYHGHQRVAI